MAVKSRPSGLVRTLAVAGCAVMLTVATAIPAAARPYVDPNPCLAGCAEQEVSGLKAMTEHVFAAKMAKELRMASGVDMQLDLNCQDLPVYA